MKKIDKESMPFPPKHHQSGWTIFSRFFVAPVGAIVCVLITSFSHSTVSFPRDQFPKEIPYTDFFQVGEELTYEVSYLSIALGTIVSKVTAIDKVNGIPQYKIEAHIRSYKGIPFTTISTIFQSSMSSTLHSISFSTREWYKDTTHKYIHYSYDQKKDLVYISERLGNEKIVEHYDTIKLDRKKYQDGCSLLFYARAHTFAYKEESVPTLVYRSKADTYIRSGIERTSIDIDAVDYPVDVMKLEGDAHFTGIFGLTGGFKGYFSADSACVPIFAQMKVLVGSVNIELIKWKRPGWQPPKGKDDSY